MSREMTDLDQEGMTILHTIFWSANKITYNSIAKGK